MTEITYASENLLAGSLGKFFIYASILAGLLSLFYYIRLLKANDKQYSSIRKKGRIFYYIQAFSVVFVGASLLYLILGHHFEYAYVYRYSSVLMPGKYIISSFWAGQEGSFLLWAILIAVYGIGALHTAKKLEGGVMAVTSVAVIFLMSMLLGTKFLGLHLGSNPIELLRNVDVNVGNEFFKNPNYLRFITDGNGLNPLLENPWMVIHPPVLFMGYAAALFPFAYALASLIQNDRRYWIKLTIPWITLSIVLLGAGLLLGGAWAYQSLTFGGFWAWDPVENASLVPWLVLVAALHYMLLTYKRDKYYWGTYIFSFLTFLTVVYASYLTRSGVLGETSVHAFGDDGLSFQLLTFMFLFTAVPAYYLYKRRSSLTSSDLPPVISREFIMLYGSVIVILAAFQIISTTSIPVFNKIFGSKIALASDVVGFYNSWQTPFAMLIALLVGLSHFVNYDNTDKRTFLKHLIIPSVVALFTAVATFIFDSDMKVIHALFMFFILFAVISSCMYLFKYISKHRNLAAGITHLGFTIFLLGILITFSNTKTLTSDQIGGTRGNNVMLFKGQAKQVGDQILRYSDSKIERDEIFYQVDFIDQEKGDMKVRYSVFPSVKYNDRMGNVHNPDTRNLLRGDVYMYLTFAEDLSKKSLDGYAAVENLNWHVNDTINAGGVPVVMDSIGFNILDPSGENIEIIATVSAKDSSGKVVSLPLTYKLNGNMAESGIISVPGSYMKIRFDKVSDMARTINVSLLEKQPEYIVLKIMFFPWIIILWIGSIIMLGGATYATYKRSVRAREV